MSKKTGRGELKSDWKDTSQPIMCCYKLVECEFKWIGLQSTVESRIQKVSLSSCSLAHLLPVRASEQGNVIGSVRIYNIYICDRLCEKGAYGAENKNVVFNLF